jgi:hypothetical protein
VARRIFLHIGTMKSATTHIQALCTRNADQLAEQGVWVPPPGLNFAAVNVLLGSSYIRPWNADAWEQLSEAIRSHDGDVFLSNEILSLRSRRKVRQLVAALAPAEVRVVLTARDLARVIPSQWQEGAVNQQTATWAAFAAAVCSDGPADSDLADRFWRRHDLPAIIERWTDSVPPSRLALISVPPGGAPGELAARLGAALDVDVSGLDEPAATHTSLGAHSAELMRRLNALVEDLDTLRYRTGFHKALARSVLAHRSGAEPRIGLSAEHHAWVVGRAREMVTDIAALDIQVIGDLDELVPGPYAAASGVDPQSATDADLLAAAMDGLAGVTRRLADVQIAYDELRRRSRSED